VTTLGQDAFPSFATSVKNRSKVKSRLRVTGIRILFDFLVEATRFEVLEPATEPPQLGGSERGNGLFYFVNGQQDRSIA
jgi:hypothetical protein